MELNIAIEELKKRKIFVGAPMYGGLCSGQFTKSCIELQNIATRYELDMEFHFLYNESLVTRARNYIADEFVRSRFTHLMFIDADIGFDPNDVIALAAIADPESDKDIVCGPYPKKCIAWEKVKRAVDKGFGDDDPENLSRYIGDYVFNPVGTTGEISIDQPVEVLEGGTGFMMIQKRVFTKFAETYSHLTYRPDHVRTDHFDGSREIFTFFDALIDDKNANVIPELTEFYNKNPNATPNEVIDFLRDKNNGMTRSYSNRYLSEDYMFCQWVRYMEMKVWLCPWMRLTHMGNYMFSGSLHDLAQVGVSATADVHSLGKEKAKKLKQSNEGNTKKSNH